MTDETTLDDLPQPAKEADVHPDELCVDGDNPNEQNDQTFENLTTSMREDGWLDGPIVANTGPIPDYDGDAEGLIADGEHRWLAAQEIGLVEVPVKFYDYDTDADRRWHRQHLNKTSGEHDSKRDALEYDYLLQHGHSEQVEKLTDAADENLDELLAELRVENAVGPAYEYDPEHNVHFEDCVAGMRERLADDSVDMVFTSPPYNVEKGDGFLQRDSEVSYSDSMDTSDYHTLLERTFSELSRVVKPDGHIFINCQIDFREGIIQPPDFITELMPLPWRSLVVWDKGDVPQGALRSNGDSQFYVNWEPIYHFSKSPRRIPQDSRNGVWSVPPISGKERDAADAHPAPYTVELVNRAIEATTSKGDIILDPFMGSGTTAVAAIQNDRDYVGFELDEEGAYQPIIERRIGEAKRQRDAEVNADSDTATD